MSFDQGQLAADTSHRSYVSCDRSKLISQWSIVNFLEAHVSSLYGFHHQTTTHRFQEEFEYLNVPYGFVHVLAPGIESVTANQESMHVRLLFDKHCRLF